MTRSAARPCATRGSFGVEDVARLFGLRPERLRYWARTGFIVPSGGTPKRPAYSFRDLVAIKVARGLLEQGASIRRVRSCLDALRLWLPEDDLDLAKVRIRVVDGRLVVDADGGPFEPKTGQRVLDFDVAGLAEEAAEVVHLPSRPEVVSPYAAFERGRRLEDTDPAAACAAYREAVEADPQFAAAWTNLGSLLADQGDPDGARDCFERALTADPDQPEARMNLAELALREGDAEVAIFGFRDVLRTDPDCYEAHYGLARALLLVGGKAQAAAHLARYCEAAERGGGDPSRLAAARRALARLRGPKGAPNGTGRP